MWSRRWSLDGVSPRKFVAGSRTQTGKACYYAPPWPEHQTSGCGTPRADRANCPVTRARGKVSKLDSQRKGLGLVVVGERTLWPPRCTAPCCKTRTRGSVNASIASGRSEEETRVDPVRPHVRDVAPKRPEASWRARCCHGGRPVGSIKLHRFFISATAACESRSAKERTWAFLLVDYRGKEKAVSEDRCSKAGSELTIVCERELERASWKKSKERERERRENGPYKYFQTEEQRRHPAACPQRRRSSPRSPRPLVVVHVVLMARTKRDVPHVHMSYVRTGAVQKRQRAAALLCRPSRQERVRGKSEVVCTRSVEWLCE